MATADLDLILRGGRVIDPAQGLDGVLDVGIRGGRAAALAPDLAPAPRTKTISVRGKVVLPVSSTPTRTSTSTSQARSA